MPGIWYTATQITLTSDLSQFLPTSSGSTASAEEATTGFLLKELSQGSTSTLLMLAIESINSPTDSIYLARLSKQLQKKLSSSNLFGFISNGSTRLSAKDKALIKKYRYLLSSKTAPQNFTSKNLTAALNTRLNELRSPLAGLVKKNIAFDPGSEILHILKTWQPQSSPDKEHGVWFSQDKRHALMVLEINTSGYDINIQEQAINTIQQVFDKYNTRQTARLLISGPGVFAVKARDQIRSETQLMSAVASLLIMLILFIAYRSPWLVLLGGIPLFSAVLAGAVVTYLIFDGIHGITLAFGMTLLGVCIDYPVHVFSHLNKSQTSLQSTQSIWPTLRLGVITTCMGYLALTLTVFTGLAQLGVFAIAGLVAAMLVTRYVLPGLITHTDLKLKTDFHVALQAYVARLVPIRKMLLVFLVLAITAWFSLFSISWENRLSALAPIPQQQKQLDNILRKELAVPELDFMAVISAKDIETVLQKSEQTEAALQPLIKDNILQGVRAPHQILPSKRTQKTRQAALPDTVTLTRALSISTRTLPFKAGVFTPFIKDIATSKHLELLDNNTLQGSLLATQLRPLLFQADNQWWGVMRFIGVNDSRALAQWFNQYADNNVQYLSITQSSANMIQRFRNETLQRLLWGALIVVAVLIAGLRNMRRVVQVLLATALALALDLVVLTALGERLNLFHLVSLLLVVGIGLDYGLFFSRPDPDSATRLRTLHGMVVCVGSTVAVFGILGMSEIPVLRAIGLTVAIGVAFCFIFAMLLSQNKPLHVS